MTTTACSTVAAPIALIFTINGDLMPRALEGLTHEELWQSPTERNNPMLWVAGHMVQTRVSMLRLLGETFETGWGDVFNRGATLGESARYPSPEEIVRVMGEIGARLFAKIASLDDESLARPASGPHLPRVKTVADQLAFFAFHDSYHVGQMAYIRKALGHSALVG